MVRPSSDPLETIRKDVSHLCMGCTGLVWLKVVVEIREAIRTSRVAVLLVSADFLLQIS